jgi:hypothetical protein
MRRMIISTAVVSSLALLAVCGATSAGAAVAGPGWTIDSFPSPTNFSVQDNPGGDFECAARDTCGNAYEVFATDAGARPTDGGPIVMSDTLPAGVTVQSVEFRLVTNSNIELSPGRIGGETFAIGSCPATEPVVRCTYEGTLAPDDTLAMRVVVAVDGATPEHARLTNQATVSGGGAPSISATSENEVNAEPAPFGPSRFEFFKAGLNGASETQASGHPYELTTTIDLANDLKLEPESSGKQVKGGNPGSVEDIKDVVVDLPLGFAGSTLAAAQCTEAQLDSDAHCPPDTIVGHLTTEPLSGPISGTTINSPIWSIAPEYGHPAEFAYIDVLKGAHVAGYVSVVPTPQGYVLRFVASEIPQLNLARIVVTFYGDPALKDAETEHQQQEYDLKAPAPPLQEPSVQVPFFTNPSACSGSPQVATIWVDSWAHPAQFQPGSNGLIPVNLEEEVNGKKVWAKTTSQSPPVTGCDTLQFTPAIGSQPTTHEADSPSGLEFEQRLPQTETVGVNATPALKDTTIVFPAGMTVDPSSADGLGTCSLAQIGWQGHAPAQPGELYDFTENKPECPESSKIGTLELETPLIAGKLYGEVFLAAQNENPFDSVFATYIVVNDPTTGVVLKLAGEVKLCASAGETIDGKTCQAAGQITSTFDETPQLPFSDLKVHFFGGPRSEFATPSNCGIYTTNSELVPWSAPGSGLPPTPFDNYVIDENCAIGFNPAFTGGSTNLQAGAYTTFQASFERQDSDQELGGAEVTLPPGLLANVPSVSECGEAELAAERADTGTGGCPASSQVGTVQAGAGPGPNPLFVPGKIFWTGPYNGKGACTPGTETACAPFGLAVVVSANPGPFHFGNVVVRQRLFINKETAATTDISDPFPTFIDPRGVNGDVNGIPIKLRRVDVEIGNLPGKPFTFNPTNCVKEKFKVGGDITSTGGQSKTLSTPFQVTNCGHLKFAPSIAFSTNGHTSKSDGASLTTKVTYPKAPQGIYSDIGYVKVELPLALPSRLTTLQKACTLKQFNENPAGCPSASDIGHVTVKTPILPGILSGPAIFVSHGGEAFPTLTMVLQGDGVTIDLVGDTFISKKGITSTTFHTVPDSPFETFELVLPQGPYSALAANGNLCQLTTTKTVKRKVTVEVKGHRKTVTRKVKETVAASLVIPNEWIAQDGTVLKQDSTITVTGCPRVHRAKAAKRHKKKR